MQILFIENIEKFEMSLDRNLSHAGIKSLGKLGPQASVVVRDKETLVKHHFRHYKLYGVVVGVDNIWFIDHQHVLLHACLHPCECEWNFAHSSFEQIRMVANLSKLHN